MKMYKILQNLYHNTCGEKTECIAIRSTNSSTLIVTFIAPVSGVQALGGPILPYSFNAYSIKFKKSSFLLPHICKKNWIHNNVDQKARSSTKIVNFLSPKVRVPTLGWVQNGQIVLMHLMFTKWNFDSDDTEWKLFAN